MSKRKAYTIDFLQKIKSINPDYKFEGEDLKAWEDFLAKEKAAEDKLMNTLQEQESSSRKNKNRRVNQVAVKTDTESLDSETDKEASEE